MEKYNWNSTRWQWERINRTQYYKCFTIQTILHHDDSHKHYGRSYRVIFPDGHNTDFLIKPGNTIKELKQWLDYRIVSGKY